MTATATNQSGTQPLLPSPPAIDTLADDAIQAVQLTADALDPVLGEYIDVYGLHAADWENRAIVVYLADGERMAEAQEALESAAAAVPGGVDLRFETAPVAMEELDQASQQLFASRAEWASDPEAVYYTLPDVLNATIQVGVGGQSARGNLPTDGKTSSGAAYEVTYSVEDAAPFYQAGSRIADQGGWTGGNWLGISAATNATIFNSSCGLGFTWRRWSDGALLGGTAEHCINPRDSPTKCNWLGVSYPTQYHDQRTLGTAVTTDPGSDSALLAPAAGTSFNATAWVGSPSTTVERNVTGSREVDMLYDVVVLSGPRNGPPTTDTETYVYGLRATTCNGPKTLTYDFVSTGGDSGAPWLTTFSNGTVRAHGQHLGGLGYNGQTRSMYTPVSRISVRLEASIAVVS